MDSNRRVLILDGSIDSKIYRPVEHWGRHLDCAFETRRLPAGDPFPTDTELDRFTHAIVTGSEASCLNDDPWIQGLCDCVARLVEHRIPVLGSCFGHQIVVRAISGRQYLRRAPRPEFGWVEVALVGEGPVDPLAGALPARFHCFSSHFDEVYILPPAWVRLGKTDMCENSIIACRQAPIWGIQQHPEIHFQEGDVLIDAMLQRLPDRKELILQNLVREKRDSQVAGDLVRAFLSC